MTRRLIFPRRRSLLYSKRAQEREPRKPRRLGSPSGGPPPVTGTTAAGANKLSSRAFQNVSPDLSDDEVLTIGGQIATLQTYELAGVKRTTTAELEAAE